MKTSLLALAVLLFAACSSNTQPTGGSASQGFPAPDIDVVFHRTVMALEEQGFSADLEMSDEQSGQVVSRWRTSLAPFAGKGFRDQAKVRITPVEGNPGFFTTETQVIRETNNNMSDPSNPGAATWANAQRNGDIEVLINSRIELYFRPAGLSRDYRQYHGLSRDPYATNARDAAPCGPCD